MLVGWMTAAASPNIRQRQCARLKPRRCSRRLLRSLSAVADSAAEDAVMFVSPFAGRPAFFWCLTMRDRFCRISQYELTYSIMANRVRPIVDGGLRPPEVCRPRRTLASGRVLLPMKNMLNGAQVIVDYLIQEKVPQVFGLCGHGNIQFIDALYERSQDIKTISVHHETVAGFMADVYYRVSGKPTATFTSCGPGSANLPIALANAFLDSVPFLAITGNVPTSQFNRGAFQELYRHYQADFPSTVRAYCKRVYQPTRGEMVPLAVRQAWKTMTTGRPGPVVLDVPFDVFREAAAEETPRPEDWTANISCRCGADPDGVAKAVDMLIAAKRPAILIGQGVKYGGAAADLKALAEKLQIPVASSASGLGGIDMSHPLALGLVARNGPYQANHATRQADVLLALGVRFDDRTSSSWLPGYSFTIPPTKLIHVDIDPDEIGRNYPVALGLMADVRTFLRQVLAEVAARRLAAVNTAARAEWLDAIAG